MYIPLYPVPSGAGQRPFLGDYPERIRDPQPERNPLRSPASHFSFLPTPAIELASAPASARFPIFSPPTPCPISLLLTKFPARRAGSRPCQHPAS